MIRPATIVCLMLVVALPALAWCAEPSRKEGFASPGELSQHVNPMIGTGGHPYLCGNTFPGATLPFGMVRLSPDTVSGGKKRSANTSGYDYGGERISGFSHTRLSGTGATDGNNFLVVPGNGNDPRPSPPLGLNARFSHDQETAFPGYYAVALPELGLEVELTATRRVGVHRYTFTDAQSPHLFIDVTHAPGGGNCKEGEVRVLPDRGEIEGSVRTFGTFSKRYGGLKVYFVARSSERFSSFALWQGDKTLPDQLAAQGDDLGVDLSFKRGSPRSTIELQLALSYVSLDNARENLEAEAGMASFDEVLAKAKESWEERLSRIRVSGGTDSQRTIFYTALYHSLIMPTLFNDVNGDYLGFDGKVHRAKGFQYFTDMSLWDTFRTVHSLYTLIAPRDQRDMIVSLLAMAEQGGYLPRWPSGNGYSNSMFGTPADIMIAETYLKGIRDFDAEAALQAMKKTASGPTSGSRFSGREDIEAYLKYQYCPSDLAKESVAKTLEYSYADASIARFAEALGHREDAELFERRARFYRNVWNPETQYFQPRDSHGSFDAAFRPLMLTYLDFSGKYTHAYVEGSALQWRWAVPFDPEGLVSLFKSREYFVRELEEFFSKSIPSVGAMPNAYYWQGNQPDLYAALLFNAAERPDLTQKWVRWILDKKYGARENGLDGNDDGGTLSAWYVFGSLGLFPRAGTDKYEITSPLWERATIKLGDHLLEIVAENHAPENVYVQKAWLNNVLLKRSWILHSEIAQGGLLRFEMGPKPAMR